MSHEGKSKSDEYYTPQYIFKELNVEFDLDVASPIDRTYCHVPAKNFITENSLEKEWYGFVWMNPPFEGRNDKAKWLDKIFEHGNGIALTPDRSSTDWWQDASQKCDALLMVKSKIKFIDGNGISRNSPSNGTTLFAYGEMAVNALKGATKLGGYSSVFKHNSQ